MSREILGTVLLAVVLTVGFCVSTNRIMLAKKLLAVALGLGLCLWLTGCAMLQSKKPFIHKGYVCYTNATVIEVKNIRENLKFKGAGVKPQKTKVCDVVIKTDQGKTMTTAQEGVECSTETINQRRTVYIYNDQIVGINHGPDEFLDEQSKVKQ